MTKNTIHYAAGCSVFHVIHSVKIGLVKTLNIQQKGFIFLLNTPVPLTLRMEKKLVQGHDIVTYFSQGLLLRVKINDFQHESSTKIIISTQFFLY